MYTILFKDNYLILSYMSIATLKKKTTNYMSTLTKRSGKPPGGYWLPQGPFGVPGSLTSVMLQDASTHYGPSGFSLQGSYRSISVGKDMKFSKQGTPYRGQYAIGWGGNGGQYYHAEPVLNAGFGTISVMGNQWEFVKQSVLSNNGMLRKKFRWVNSGQYPNNWVQPVYTGNLTDTASQGQYIHDLSAANDCVVDVNDQAKYVGHIVSCGATQCQTTPARGYTMNLMQSNAAYTKNIKIPIDASQQTLRVQRRCANPKPWQKPFPYRVQTGTGILTGGTSVNSVGSACNTSNIKLVPPDWYLAAKPGTDIKDRIGNESHGPVAVVGPDGPIGIN